MPSKIPKIFMLVYMFFPIVFILPNGNNCLTTKALLLCTKTIKKSLDTYIINHSLGGEENMR